MMRDLTIGVNGRDRARITKFLLGKGMRWPEVYEVRYISISNLTENNL